MGTFRKGYQEINHPLVWFAILLAACQPAPTSPPPTEIHLPTARLEATDTLPPTEAAGSPNTEPANPVSGLPRYQITVDFDYQRRAVAVSETLSFSHTSGDPLEELILIIEPARLVPDFTLLNLAWDSAEGAPVEGYRLEDGLLHVPLEPPMEPNGSLTVFISFAYPLPERTGPFGATERQAVFTNWYALLPPYREEGGWLVYPPAVAGEHISYPLADYLVEIRPSSGQVMIAGPVTPTRQGAAYVYDFPGARSFAWAASDEYDLIQTKVGEIPLNVYVFQDHYLAGFTVQTLAIQALETFQPLFGPYPYPSLTVVEIEDDDGMEADGMFFLGDIYFPAHANAPENWLTLLVPHETAHMWWFGQVGNDQAAEPWLDEALATYSELLFYQQVYPYYENFWWWFRIGERTPSAGVDADIYTFRGYFPYVDTVYIHGAEFIHALREAVGDEAFFAALRSYLAIHQGGLADGEDFLAALLAETDVPLDPILATYFQGAE